jgi:hypothetical protein
MVDAVQGVSVLNSDSELFVFIDHARAVLAESRFKLLAKQLTSVALFPEHVSDDLLVVHLKGSKISTYDLIGFGVGGSPFVFHGNTYWGRGRERGSNEPRTWRWNGSNFIPLSDPDTDTLYGQFKYFDEITQTEGWHQKSFNTDYRQPEAIIQLRNEDIRIYSESHPGLNGNGSRTRVMLVQSEKTNSPKELIDIDNGFRTISEVEYLKLIAQKHERQ